MTGKVKMFNKEKGFGFITTDEGKDVFFHYSAIIFDGYKTAEAGEAVEFKVLAAKSFDAVEKGAYGEELQNHSFVASKGLTVEVEVVNFAN